MDPITLGLIGLGVGLLTSGAGLGISARNSKKNRQLQKNQNELDRMHEYQMWQLQMQEERKRWEDANAFNHPEQQMQRLREAGLNPNLVYGKGADNTANVLAPKQATPSSKPAPQIAFDATGLNRIGSSISEFAQVRALSAQTDNTYMHMAKTAAETAKTEFDLEQAKALRQTVIEQANANLTKTKTETEKMGKDMEKIALDMELSIEKNYREHIANQANVQLTLEKVITENIEQKQRQLNLSKTPLEVEKLQKEIDLLVEAKNNAKQEGRIKKAEAQLREQGINPNDPSYVRMLIQLLFNVADYVGVPLPIIGE